MRRSVTETVSTGRSGRNSKFDFYVERKTLIVVAENFMYNYGINITSYFVAMRSGLYAEH